MSKKCMDCEYFDHGSVGSDGHSDCHGPRSMRLQTYAHDDACPGFYPDTTLDMHAYFIAPAPAGPPAPTE